MTLFEHFPEAKLVFDQFPRAGEVMDLFVDAGFLCQRVERVTQQTCSNLTELAARTRLRSDTTLVLMTDEAYHARQAALEAAAREGPVTPVYETVDLVAFRKAD
jgi:hypothetical protein